MSREIKFRCWHKNAKEMMTVDLVCFQEKYIESQKSSQPMLFEHVELMQFTGLTDKNGVEIYEGDIIPYGGKNYTVEMLQTSWTLAGYVGMDYYGRDEPELQDWSEFEVVGNIHENPELLK